jgi:threonine/homoserine/homoserine lactone efflux protein
VQALNPKNLLFYLSLFTVVLTNNVGLAFKISLGLWMTFVVFAWDSLIIYLLSANKVRNKFSSISFYIDKVTGAILGLIGFTIIKSAVTR